MVGVMPTVPDYPDDLQHPLTRGELSLRGVRWREIQGPLWRSPFRGVHVWSGTDPAAPLQRALDAAALLPPDGALGGWGAATVAGVTELDGYGSAPQLCLPPGRSRRRGDRLITWQSPLDADDVVEIGGVRVTSAVRTAFDLARFGSAARAVEALDVLGRGRPELAEELARYAEKRPGWRGLPQVRRAITRATPRARSVRETTFRLFWIDECGLPAPQVNAAIRDGSGHLLGLGDLLDPGTGLVGEYDGGGHRQERQHALDNAREEALEDAGLTVVRVSNPDLGIYRRRTRMRLETGLVRARRTPRGLWSWEPGPLPTPVPRW